MFKIGKLYLVKNQGQAPWLYLGRGEDKDNAGRLCRFWLDSTGKTRNISKDWDDHFSLCFGAAMVSTGRQKDL